MLHSCLDKPVKWLDCDVGQYILINEWVQASDMSALTDIVPTMNNVLITAVCVLIALNAITAFLKSKRLRNTLVTQ